MKRLNYWVTLGALTALTGVPLCSAAEAEIKAKADLPDVNVKADIDRDKTDRELRSDRDAKTTRIDAREAREHGVKKTNKASGILGMEVRNNQNEKLGEIKDLALDLNSGKVSYAVLAVGGFLGLGEKLIAVPTSSLQIAEDHSFLMLDADKAKIQAAPGFAATNWPRLDDPDLASARYWRSEHSVGGPAGSEIRTDSDHKVRSDLDVKSEKRDKLYTDAREHRTQADLSVDKDRKSLSAETRLNGKDYKVVHGKVSSVDAKHHLIVVQTDTGEKRVFNVDDQATLRAGKEKNVQLDDFKAGYDVDIQYDSNGGRMTAYGIQKTTP